MKFTTAPAVLQEWMRCVNTADTEGLLALYDPQAVLIPTFAPTFLNRPEKMRDYFTRLCSRSDLSIALHAKTLVIQATSDTLHVVSGVYCWRFSIDDELFSFEARFSFVLDLARPAPIVHHHSSQIPRTL
jgi:hypothetical protein